jgi:hypothetical protein
MSLTFNAESARNADKTSNIIRETGKYTGVITRAEKLLSSAKTQGVGFSFKADDGSTANYLDVYTVKADGKELWGANLVQSVLACTKTREAPEGPITFEKWDNSVREMVQATAPGYPALMGKRVGFVLQRELGTNPKTGNDTDKVILVRVFEAGTGFTSSEILDKATKAVKLDEFMKGLMPVRDTRKKAPALSVVGAAPAVDDFDDSIPF